MSQDGPPIEKNGKVSARPATPNRETAAKGEKGEKVRMAERFKALRSVRSLVLQARVRIPLLTTFVNRKPTVSH